VDSERDATGMMAVAVVNAGISRYAGLLLSSCEFAVRTGNHSCRRAHLWHCRSRLDPLAGWSGSFAAATPSGVTGFWARTGSPI